MADVNPGGLAVELGYFFTVDVDFTAWVECIYIQEGLFEIVYVDDFAHIDVPTGVSLAADDKG